MKRTSRKPSNLSESLQRHLNAYALAASAAGVGMLALGQSAEAKIVYTPANVLANGFHLDLNGDAVTDFYFSATTHGHRTFGNVPRFDTASQDGLFILPYGANAVWEIPSEGGPSSWAAAALSRGIAVHAGPRRRFGKKRLLMLSFGQAGSSSGFWNGPWVDVTQRYLGLKFYIEGKPHYGWACLNTQGLNATLTGYAYETIPNKPIVTGKTKGPDVITLKPGSLGALAAGASRLHDGK